MVLMVIRFFSEIDKKEVEQVRMVNERDIPATQVLYILYATWMLRYV